MAKNKRGRRPPAHPGKAQHHVGEQLKKQVEIQKGNLPVEEVENEEFMPFSPEIQQAMNRILREATAKKSK